MKKAGHDAGRPREELANDAAFIKRVQQDAVELTRELSDYERVKRVHLLPREFSIDKGEMTPTLKVKRNVIDEKYEKEIDEICG
jgi:long-chain acyl-CoA synthetase